MSSTNRLQEQHTNIAHSDDRLDGLTTIRPTILHRAWKHGSAMPHAQSKAGTEGESSAGFFRDGPRNSHSGDVEIWPENHIPYQELDTIEGYPPLARACLVVVHDHKSETTSSARKKPKGKPGRPKKRGRPKSKKPDGRLKKLSGPITVQANRNRKQARDFAKELGRELDTCIDINPAYLDSYPECDIGDWVRTGPLKSLAGFTTRVKDDNGRPVGWFAVGNFENYEGERQHHFHLMIHAGTQSVREKVRRHLERACPGERAVKISTKKMRIDPETGRWVDAPWNYRSKQIAGNALGPPKPGRPHRETHSRHGDHPAVAAVLGKRVFISKSIDLPARIASGWQAMRDKRDAETKAFYRAQAEREKISVALEIATTPGTYEIPEVATPRPIDPPSAPMRAPWADIPVYAPPAPPPVEVTTLRVA